jgi:Ligand-gated ion channel.
MFAGHDVTPRSLACRLVYWLGYVTAVVVLAAYSATLISFLTIQNQAPPFNTLEELVKDRSYQMVVLKSFVAIITDVRLQPCVLLL